MRVLSRLTISIAVFFAWCVAGAPVQVFAAPVSNPSDINANSVFDKDETLVVIDTDTELPAGEYFFNDLKITNNATLVTDGNSYSTSTFKGVKINAVNLTVDAGAKISADSKGYDLVNPGPGAPVGDAYYLAGASYGGAGRSSTTTSIYGSAVQPVDLGSAGNRGGFYGGGALWFAISNSFTNNGEVSVNGSNTSSGGSIYVVADKISGTGTMRANGGTAYCPNVCFSMGGGGRIAVHYNTSIYAGLAEARGGCMSFDSWTLSCADSGTVGFFDDLNNDLYITSSWRFQNNDGPFHLHTIFLSNGANVLFEDGAEVNAGKFFVDGWSSVEFLGKGKINISDIFVSNNSKIKFSGEETLSILNLSIASSSVVTVAPERVLSLSVVNLSVDTSSIIDANEKGYGYGAGPGAPVVFDAGASYGGAGSGQSVFSTYGSETEPTDFGSGGFGYNPHGGGAVRIDVSGIFINDGVVRADGANTSSGGSIYVTAHEIKGAGSFHANGGEKYCPNVCRWSGGGGRVALYYDVSSYTGDAVANGVNGSGNGTVFIKQRSVCVVDCYSNVLFIPGLEASRLYRSGSVLEDQLWEPNNDGDVEDLFLDENGKSVQDGIYTRDVIDEKNVLIVGQGNVYLSFLDDLKAWKEDKHLINDYGVAPYDWRMQLEDILSSGNKDVSGNIYYSGSVGATLTPYIIEELHRLAKNSKTGKVTIVAHSNGGLVTKALVEKLGAEEASKLIDNVIFVAVPQAGTPQAVGAVLHGYDQGLPFDSFSPILSQETARTLAINMPSTYNLLPSQSYFTYVDNPVVKFDDSDLLAEFRSRYGTTIHSSEMLKNFITDTRRSASSTPGDVVYPAVGNSLLYSKAESVHTLYDTWTPPADIKLYEVAGWGEDTLSTIQYYRGLKSECIKDAFTHLVLDCKFVPTIMYRPIEVVEGDGTVVVPSALWTPTSSTTKKYWVNLREYDSKIRYERKHADILEVPELRTLVENILANKEVSLSFISTTTPIAVTTDNRLRFVLHSPLNLSAVDGLGNIVNSATSTIPGARYKHYGEVQVLTVPKNTSFALNLDGYASGSFTLDIDEVDGNNNIVASSTIEAVPSATTTKARIDFTDGTIQNMSPLVVDYDGNGTNDFKIASKVGAKTMFDITPPEVRILFSTSTQKIIFEGIDENPTTVTTTASSTLVTDEAGNTLELFFKLKAKGKEAKLEIRELRYNSIATSTLSKNILQYQWSTDKIGSITQLEEKAEVGSQEIEGHYSGRKNTTKLEIDSGEKENSEIFSGLKILEMETRQGSITINY